MPSRRHRNAQIIQPAVARHDLSHRRRVMASGRFVSTRLGDSEKFDALDDARWQVAYMLLLTWSDAEGRFIADPVTIKGHVLTRVRWATPEAIEEGLNALHRVGLIRLYEVSGKRYGLITNFHEFNKIKRGRPNDPLAPKYEAASKLPPISEGVEIAQRNSELLRETLSDSGVSDKSGQDVTISEPTPINSEQLKATQSFSGATQEYGDGDGMSKGNLEAAPAASMETHSKNEETARPRGRSSVMSSPAIVEYLAQSQAREPTPIEREMAFIAAKREAN